MKLQRAETYEELKARGVEFTGGTKEASWGTFATFKDPDGNLFLLSSR
jgi:predicted enzyme related to lactoylglutathione lyase